MHTTPRTLSLWVIPRPCRPDPAVVALTGTPGMPRISCMLRTRTDKLRTSTAVQLMDHPEMLGILTALSKPWVLILYCLLEHVILLLGQKITICSEGEHCCHCLPDVAWWSATWSHSVMDLSSCSPTTVVMIVSHGDVSFRSGGKCHIPSYDLLTITGYWLRISTENSEYHSMHIHSTQNSDYHRNSCKSYW